MGDKYLKKIFIKKPLYKEFYVNLQTIRVYKDLIISTIVDSATAFDMVVRVYKDLIISTIVD